jgi:hypothetical protein
MPLDPGIYNLSGGGRQSSIADPFAIRAAQIEMQNRQLQAEGLAEQRRSIAEERQMRIQAAQVEAEEDRRVMALFQGNQLPTAEMLYKEVRPERAEKLLKGLQALQVDALKHEKEVGPWVGAAVNGVLAYPKEGQQQAYTVLRQKAIRLGMSAAELPEAFSEEFAVKALDWARTAEQRHDSANPKPIVVNGSIVQKDAEGKYGSVYDAPAADREVTPGTLGDYMESYAQSLGLKSSRQMSPKQKLAAKAQFEAAGRAPQRDDSALVAVMGENGQPVLVPRSQAVGKTPASSARPLTQTAEATMIGRLANDWTKANASTKEIDRQVRIMDAGLSRFDKDPNGASQAVLVTFQKILDPESVVRESEYARSSEGISAIQRIEGWMERISKGGAGVPKEQLREMAATAKLFQQATKQGAEGVRRRLTATAERYNIPPEMVFDSVSSNPAAVNVGTVKMQAPDGTIKDVPSVHVEFYKSKGAKIVGGGQ